MQVANCKVSIQTGCASANVPSSPMAPHSCITSAFQAQALTQWDQQPGPNILETADRQESLSLQLTPLPSFHLASSFPFFSSVGLEHIFDSDSDVDALQPWAQPPVRQPGNPVQAAQARQPSLQAPSNNMKRSTATSAADAGAAVEQLKQKQRTSDQDHMRSYLAQLSDVQHTLRERAALAATLSSDAASTHHSNPGEEKICSEDYSSVDEEDNDDDDDDHQEEEYIIRPAKRPNTASNQPQVPEPARPTAAADAPQQMVVRDVPHRQPTPPVTSTAGDDSFESTLRYLAQLSDVQTTLHQNATLAATLHLPTNAPAVVPRPPVTAVAATTGGAGSPVQSRKRTRSSDKGRGSNQSAAVVVATAAVTHGRGPVVAAGLSGAPQPGSEVVAAVSAGVAVPQSSFKGVEYLPAERKWQAYAYDSSIGEVVFLDKYEHELDAALAHDRELLRRFGPAAAQLELNFSNSTPGPAVTPSSPAATTATTAVAVRLPAVSSSNAAAVVVDKGTAAASDAGTVGNSVSQRQLAAAAAWAAAHEAAARAVVPESRYKGVEYLPAEMKWQAYMLDTTDNQVVWLDKFGDEVQAAEAHDAAVINKLGAAAAVAAGQVNFPNKIPPAALLASQEEQRRTEQNASAISLPIKPLQLHGLSGGVAAADGGDSAPPAADVTGVAEGQGGAAAGKKSGRQGARGRDTKPISQYKGVSWSSSCHKWAAVIWDRVSKKARHVGVYASEEEAARAYDMEVIATQGAKNTGLNFRDSVDRYRAEVGEPSAPAAGAAGGGGGSGAVKANSSEYRGVSWHERSKRWEARAWGGGRQHFVGSFSSAIEAARAYDRAILKLGGAGPKSASRLNFPLTDYDLDEIAAMNFPQNTGNKRPPVKRARKQDGDS